MFSRSLKSRLETLIREAESQRRESPFIPQSDWPPGLREANKEFDRKLATAGGNRYETLLDNLESAPQLPLKEPWNRMQASEDSASQRELYEIVRQAVRARA